MQNQNLSGENHLEKPCLVETSQGFSVSYKNRLLYSKYSPKRSICQIVQSLNLLPGTLILCASPVLWYGLQELEEKLPENCIILGIETDKELFELAKSELLKIKSENEKINAQLLPINEIEKIVEIILGKEKSEIQFPKIHNFKRAIMIEMSAGTVFDKDFYNMIATVTENAIASFWKNRITLTKFGRLFSKNLFKNIANLKNSFDIKSVLGKIEKPILVFGAGESTGIFLEKFNPKVLENFFVLAVDAVSPVLKTKSVKIDGIVAVESQIAIEKSYIGGNAKDSMIFADISSRPQVTKHTNQEVLYFASEFADTQFFRDLSKKDFFPPVVPPLGSVGLTATYLALLLRKNTEIPIFTVGLDFSFSLGATHTKGVHANIFRHSISDRLNPSENYDSAFKLGAKKVLGKNGKPIFTDIALLGYAQNFCQTFRNQKNLFDCGEVGLDLGLSQIKPNDFWNFARNLNPNQKKLNLSKNKNIEEIGKFLKEEEKALNRIKELLIFGNDVAKCDSTVESELEELISCREYLFLHFADGFRFDVKNLSMLKRISTEIDNFLKLGKFN